MLSKRKRPSLPVVVVSSLLVSRFFSVTVALGTAALPGSMTLPLIAPATADCAHTRPAPSVKPQTASARIHISLCRENLNISFTSPDEDETASFGYSSDL